MKELTVNLFYRCNARCVFCVVGLTGGAQSTARFSLEEAKQTLAAGFEQGCRRVTFSGGEPTIYPGLSGLIASARDFGYEEIEIKTNGIRLSSYPYIKELADAGLSNLSISIHGPTAAVHDALVGVPRAFERAVQGARHAKNLGTQLSLPTCIQIGNFRVFPETIEFLLSLSPDLCLPTFIEPSGSAAYRFDAVVPWYSEVLPYLDRGVVILQQQTATAWALHGFPMCTLYGKHKYSFDLLRGMEFVGKSESKDYFAYEKNTYRAKTDKCRRCNFEAICGGPWKEYVRNRGWDEFKPILDISPTEVIPLSRLVRSVFPENDPGPVPTFPCGTGKTGGVNV